MLSNIWDSIVGIFDTLKEIATFILNFFDSLLDFLVNIFIPTDEQWEEIAAGYSDLGDEVKEKLPFVSEFTESLENATSNEQNNPLIINLPSFNYSGSGGIGVVTSQKQVNLTEVYEPYRVYIRGFLFLIVVGLAFVYIVKHVVKYGETQNDGGGSE